MDADFTMMLKSAVEIGITPVLLIIFVKYFFDRDKNRDKQLEDQYRSFHERENNMAAEAARREELLRQEAEKREMHLMVTIEGFSNTMGTISNTMSEMKNAFIQVEHKVTSIEEKLEKMRSDAG